VSWHLGFLVLLFGFLFFGSSLVSWHLGSSLVSWHLGFLVLLFGFLFFGSSLVSWHLGFLVLLFGFLVLFYKCFKNRKFATQIT